MSRRTLLATAYVYQTAHDLASQPEISHLLDSELALAQEIVSAELDNCEEHIYETLRQERVKIGGKRRKVTSESMRYGVHIMLDTVAGAFNDRAKACRRDRKLDGLPKGALEIMALYTSQLARLSMQSIYKTRDVIGDQGGPLFYKDTLCYVASMKAAELLLSTNSPYAKQKRIKVSPPRLLGSLPTKSRPALKIVC